MRHGCALQLPSVSGESSSRLLNLLLRDLVPGAEGADSSLDLVEALAHSLTKKLAAETGYIPLFDL